MDIGIILLCTGGCISIGHIVSAIIVARAIDSAEERLSAHVGGLPNRLAHLRVEALIAEAQKRAPAVTEKSPSLVDKFYR